MAHDNERLLTFYRELGLIAGELNEDGTVTLKDAPVPPNPDQPASASAGAKRDGG